MQYRRTAMEIESPEEFGYENIENNLAESSVSDATFKDLQQDLSKMVLSYSDHRGKLALRELIAMEGEGLHPENVLITHGAALALFIVYTTLLNRGDHIIVAHPNYVLNIECPRAIKAEVEFIKYVFENQWRLDIDKLASIIRPETKLVSLTFPHNPTGTMISEEDLLKVITIVEEHGCYLLVDETYRDMTFSTPLPVAATLSRRAISVASMSKSYGLPGIRIGWLIFRDKELVETFLGAKEQIVICNSILDEEIAYHVIKQKDTYLENYRLKIQRGLKTVTEWIDGQDAFEWVRPSGGAVGFLCIKPNIAVDIDKFYKVLLEDYKTFVAPGHWFEVDRRFMRIGFGFTGQDELSSGLRCITKALEDASI